MVAFSSKIIVLFAVLCLAIIHSAYASIYSQLQFIKIDEPKNGQDVVAGKPLTVKYVMQPLIRDNVEEGKALKLSINFHKRTGDKKEQQIAVIHKDCPVSAKTDKYVTYTKKWTIPKDTKPGSYAVDFIELVQFRRGQITSTETVKVNVVD